jgi:CheY-like chemotaxis protein
MSELAAKRILVLEDEILLAIEAAETLEELGAVVIGPVHRVEAAMALLDMERPDAALLDVNINGSTSAPVAQRLRQAEVPFVLATGYGNQSGITGQYAVIDKPYNPRQIQTVFTQMLSYSTSPPPARS